MRICVPTATDQGMDAAVHGHFGSAPFFSVLDTDKGEVEIVSNANQRHEHGQCNPVGALMGIPLDAVVVRGMGRNALARLNQAGIPVYLTTGQRLRDVATEIADGLARPLDFNDTCAGHGGHDHHHHHRG